MEVHTMRKGKTGTPWGVANFVYLVGNLTADPRYDEARGRLSFRIACDNDYVDARTGEVVSRPLYIDVDAYGSLAGARCDQIYRGDRVVVGSLRSRGRGWAGDTHKVDAKSVLPVAYLPTAADREYEEALDGLAPVAPGAGSDDGPAAGAGAERSPEPSPEPSSAAAASATGIPGFLSEAGFDPDDAESAGAVGELLSAHPGIDRETAAAALSDARTAWSHANPGRDIPGAWLFLAPDGPWSVLDAILSGLADTGTARAR